MMLIAAVRCVFSKTEQPGGSIMPEFPYIKEVQRSIAKLRGFKRGIAPFCPCLSNPKACIYAMCHH